MAIARGHNGTMLLRIFCLLLVSLPVYAQTTLTLDPTVIAPNRELKVVVSFSETYSRGPKHQVLARFSLADGAFTGMFRLKFTTEEMVETVTAAETGALQTVAASEPEAVTA